VVKRLIGIQDNGAFLIPAAHHMEKQIALLGIDRNLTKLIQIQSAQKIEGLLK